MRIALLGPNGQLGWELRRSLAVLGELVVLDRSQASMARCGDLTHIDALIQTLRELQADVVVNAAAYTAVDRAETDQALAQLINAEAPGAIASEANRQGAWLVHFSTDYVFDGSGHSARDEDAATGPLNIYGQSKLAGEQAVRASGCRHLILRTSWVHSARGANFARTMLRLATQRENLNVVNDQIGAPTPADLLADVTAHALRSAVADPGLAGTYHACATGEVSWCDYARHVLDWGHRVGLPLRATRGSVHGIPSSQFLSAAARPLNSRLNTEKLRRNFGLALPHWQLGLDRVLDEALPDLMFQLPKLPTPPT